MRNKNIVAIIPARGGSKGIRGKNLINFCGKPLLAWTILQAKASKYIRKVYVSSDNKRILKNAGIYGAETIKRPKELASDIASSEAALKHSLDVIQKRSNRRVDLVVFLQATSPLRETSDIDNAIGKFNSGKADSMFSASILEDFCIWSKERRLLKSVSYDYKKRGRRQNRPPLFLENGSFYIFKPKILKMYNNRLGGRIDLCIMENWKSYEIDKKEDIEICSYYMKKKLNQKRRKI
jgi:CMP-N,N'-diacetyllegionaminic acid synthase